MKTLFYLYLCWSATTGQVESQQLDEEYLPAKSYETIPKVSSLKILWSMIHHDGFEREGHAGQGDQGLPRHYRKRVEHFRGSDIHLEFYLLVVCSLTF